MNIVQSGRGSVSKYPSRNFIQERQQRSNKRTQPLNPGKQNGGQDLNLKELLVSDVGSKEILAQGNPTNDITFEHLHSDEDRQNSQAINPNTENGYPIVLNNLSQMKSFINAMD